MRMEEKQVLREIAWEAPEHNHIEKSADWYWALGIVAIAAAVASILFQNTLLAMVILLGTSTVIVFSHRRPKVIPFGVSQRGVMVGRETHLYPNLESYYLDETNTVDPQLIVKSKHLFSPLIILPIPVEYIDDIEDLVSSRLPEEHLEEPLGHKLLEFLGF